MSLLLVWHASEAIAALKKLALDQNSELRFAASENLVSISRDIATNWARELTLSKVATERHAAIELWAQLLPLEEAVTHLKTLADTPDRESQLVLAQAVTHPINLIFGEELVMDILESDATPNHRQTAAWILRYSASEWTEERLKTLLRDKDDNVRQAAAIAFTQRLLESDKSQALTVAESYTASVVDADKQTAAWMLGEIGGTEAEEKLKTLLDNDFTEQAAAVALVRVSGARAVELAMGYMDPSYNDQLLDRTAAVWMWREIGGVKAATKLGKILEIELQDYSISLPAARALAHVDPERALALAEEYSRNASSSSITYKSIAVNICVELNTPQSVAILKKLVGDANQSLAFYAMDNLIRISPDQALLMAVEYARSAKWEFRKEAAIRLGQLGGPEAVKTLKTLTQDSHSHVIIEAQQSLDKFGAK